MKKHLGSMISGAFESKGTKLEELEVYEEKKQEHRTVSVLCVLLGACIGLLAVCVFFVIRYGRFFSVIETAEVMEKNYYFYPEENGEETLVAGANKGMVAYAGDEYSAFYTRKEYEKLLESESGTYEGIGILISAPDGEGALIQKVYENSPLEKAGGRTGDILLEINGRETRNRTLNEILEYFNETENTLTLSRNGEVFEVTVGFDKVTIPFVEYCMETENIGYVRLDEFLGNAYEELSEAIETLRKEGMTALILDVRDNPGGNYDVLEKIAGLFLKKGDLLTTMKSRNGKEREYFVKTDGCDIPMVILVNENTASAAELLTGALQYYGRAEVLGTRTFGKGIVQSFFGLSSGSGYVKITTEEYLLPGGVSIHGTGVRPDIPVEQADENAGKVVSMIEKDEDIVRREAVRILSAM